MLDYQGAPPYWGLKVEDDVHVRYHCFTQYSDVALADGYPPKGGGSEQPKVLRYLLAHSVGGDYLNTTNVALVEPFRGQPLIASARRLAIANQQPGLEAVALEVQLADGATDYVLSGPDDDTAYEVAGGIRFSGRLAAFRVTDGQVQRAWLCRAAKVSWRGFEMALPAAAYQGTIARMDRELKTHACVWTETPLPTDGTLVGSEIIIGNDRALNACYTIAKIEQDGGLYKVDCGEVCFVRGFVDDRDYSKGYTYNFAEGSAWVIPQHARLSRQPGGVLHAAMTGPLAIAWPDGR
jgi:hypothetical protein